MTRLTPEDENYVAWLVFVPRADNAYAQTIKVCDSDTPGAFKVSRTSEIDALRAERDLLSRGLDIETAEIESLHEEIEMLRADDDPSFVRHAEHLAALKTVEQLRAENKLLTTCLDRVVEDAGSAEFVDTRMEITKLKAEIATFRNASPSLCNCSQCIDIRNSILEGEHP